jgi:hypothetical protein
MTYHFSVKEISRARTSTPRYPVVKPKVATNSNAEDLEEHDDELLSLNETIARLVPHRIAGLTCRELIRRAIVDKRITAIKGKPPKEGWLIRRSEIDGIIAREANTVETEVGVHKKLFEFYSADPLHNPVLAVREGLLKSADEAARVYRLFKKHQQSIAAFDARKKQQDWQAEQTANAANEPPCESCGRVYFIARQDSAEVVSRVTGRTADFHRGAQFEFPELKALDTYREEGLCPRCSMWKPNAPVVIMQRTLSLATSSNQPTKTESDILKSFANTSKNK